MTYKTTYELNKDSFKALKETLAIKNPMQAPHLSMVVVSVLPVLTIAAQKRSPIGEGGQLRV